MLSHNFPDFDTLFGQASGKATNSLDDVLSDMDRALEMTLGSYLNVADAYVDFMMSLPFYNTVVNFFEKLCMTICSIVDRVEPRIDNFLQSVAESRMFKAFADLVMTFELKRERFILSALDAFFDSAAYFLIKIDPFVPESIKAGVSRMAIEFIRMRDQLYNLIHFGLDPEIRETDFN